jgi:hypothetical protein
MSVDLGRAPTGVVAARAVALADAAGAGEHELPETL